MQKDTTATETRYFEFMIDEKCTVWQRTTFQTKGKTKEEARKTAIEMFNSGEVDELPCHMIERETLYDTMTPMNEEENEGENVLEIACNNDEHLNFEPIKK